MMQSNIINTFGLGLGLGVLFIVLLAWSFLWKGLALWHSARKGDFYWFIAFLFLNTLGILEIIYLFAVLKLKLEDLFKK